MFRFIAPMLPQYNREDTFDGKGAENVGVDELFELGIPNLLYLFLPLWNLAILKKRTFE